MKSIFLLSLAGASRRRYPAQPRVYTAADYERAEKALGTNTNSLVFRTGIRPTWLPDERFWYRVTSADGSEFILVDTAKGTRAPAFDHARLASASAFQAWPVRSTMPRTLPFTEIDLAADGVSFNVSGKRYKCDVAGNACAETGAATAGAGGGGRGGRGGGRGGRGGGGGGRSESMSPDGKHAVFIRDYNLWARDVASGQETQLTKKDGEKGISATPPTTRVGNRAIARS